MSMKVKVSFPCEHCREQLATNKVERSRTNSVHLCDSCLKSATPAEILTLDQLRHLSQDDDCSGVYFLWNGDSLQYIGQSICIGNRLADHERAYTFGALRAKATKQIKFDRATCLAFDRRPYMDPDERQKLRDRMLVTERVYIERYRPPFNTEWFL